MLYNLKNEDDLFYSSEYYETNIEDLVRKCFINNKGIKLKLLFFLFNFFVLYIVYYKFLTYESLILFNNHKTSKLFNSANKILEIDNKLEENYYEDNIDYSQYSTKIKAISIYFPNIYLSLFSAKIIAESNIQKYETNYVRKYYQDNFEIKAKKLTEQNRRKNFDKNQLKSYDFHEYRIITKQIQLAKSHGLYGFAFYIYFYTNNLILDKYVNTFLENRIINFNYLFILKHKNLYYRNEEMFIIKKYNNSIPNSIISKIKGYLIDKRYIKIDSKPIICIDSFKKVEKLKTYIESWRMEAKKFGIKELFFITSLNSKNISNNLTYKIFNAGYENLPKYLLGSKLLVNFIKNYTFFSGLIYRDINFKIIEQFPIYRASTLENQFKIKNHSTFGEYSPESFYIMNKMIINWTINHFNKSEKFIFINSWNNYYEGNYLEPENKYGYGSLNALSKALFRICFKNITYNLSDLSLGALIAVQAHIFHIDLIMDVISITNNIPVKFDFYITTNTLEKKKIIKEYIKKYSKANIFEIKLVKNKGRDILPLLIQMRDVINKYKYFCHIHTKKTLQNPKYGFFWRKYLYKNLLGSVDIISKILSEFEKENKLGFLFPEAFYEAKESELKLDQILINSMNYLIYKMFKEYQIGQILDFPAGDMFWAKTKAVYQIFKINLSKDIYMEGKGPQTLLFAIERIWLYIVKYNGYYYKKICGYY